MLLDTLCLDPLTNRLTSKTMPEFEQNLGYTRSLKPIILPVSVDTQTLVRVTGDYDTDDYFDAYAMFQYLLSRELALLGRDSPRIQLYDAIAAFHSDQLGDALLMSRMDKLSLATIFDVLDFGKSRANAVFP